MHSFKSAFLRNYERKTFQSYTCYGLTVAKFNKNSLNDFTSDDALVAGETLVPQHAEPQVEQLQLGVVSHQLGERLLDVHQVDVEERRTNEVLLRLPV